MNGRLQFFQYLSHVKKSAIIKLSNALSIWRRQLLTPEVSKEFNTLLPKLESSSLTMKVHDQQIPRLLRAHRLYRIKLDAAEQKHSASINHFSSSILGIQSDSNKFDLPKVTKLLIIYPELYNIFPDRNDQIKQAKLGKMLLELACWTYSMKYFKSGRGPGQNFPINGFNFDNLGTVSPAEETAHTAEQDYLRYSKKLDDLMSDNHKSVHLANSKVKAILNWPIKPTMPSSYRYSPSNHFNICRPPLLSKYVKHIGLCDLIIFETEYSSGLQTDHAVAALYKTVGEIARYHDPETAMDFVKTRLIEGSNGLLHFSSDI